MVYVVLKNSEEINGAIRSQRPSQMLWSRIGIHTILWTNEDNSSFQSDLKKIGVEIDRNSVRSSKGQLYLVTQVGSSFQRDYPDVPVVVEKGRYLVVDVSFEQLASMDKNDENCWMLRPLMPNQVILDVIRPERKKSSLGYSHL